MRTDGSTRERHGASAGGLIVAVIRRMDIRRSRPRHEFRRNYKAIFNRTSAGGDSVGGSAAHCLRIPKGPTSIPDRMIFAGLPATMLPGGTSLVTTAPAP